MEQASTAQELPELSVVVCTLGAEPVAATVDSIARSAETNDRRVEIVLVWQGEEAPPSLAGATVLDVFPVDLSYARNRGLAAARAPLVAFVDDDEVVDAGWVEGVFAGFARREIAGVFGPVEPLDDRGLAYCHYEPGAPREFTGGRTPPWIVGTGGNMAFRRDVLAGAGGFDIRFGAGSPAKSAEETDLVLRLLGAGRTIAWSPTMVVYHPTKDEAQHLASRHPYGIGMGSALRRHRAAGHVARYLVAIGQTFSRAVRARDARRRREALATFRAFTAGLVGRRRARSPEVALSRLPDELRARLDGAAVRPLSASLGEPPTFSYAVGDDRLLYAYIGVDDGDHGDGEVLAEVKARDAVWVLRRR